MLTVGMYLADRYEIVSKIGAGGMSDVYKAKDHILGRFVAIKVLKQEFSEDRNFVTKFRTEAQSAAGLEHPNIVNIYDVGSEDGLHYIVMEHVEGITLKTYIEKKGQLSFKESVSIAIQVSRGIEAAHNKNIIHRDIKPQNIIISTEGKVKVTDFGIARAASANTISSDVMGSVHYASPEQARNGFVDNRSDIYSLGILMYEMVTGRVPFDGDTTVAVAIQHLQEEMVPPSSFAPELPVSMEKIILKCAQKNPDRRYQTIADLLADLRKALISPEEDFVEMVNPLDNGKTKVISAEELSAIKGTAVGKNDDDEEEQPARAVSKPAPKPVVKTSSIVEDEDADDDDEEDDDEEDALDPKLDRVVSVMGILAALLLIAVIVAMVMKVGSLFSDGSLPNLNPQNTQNQSSTQKPGNSENSENPDKDNSEVIDNTVPMINVLGMTFSEAQDALDELGITVYVTGTEESEDAVEGTILSQSVAANTMVEKGSTVNVVIATAVTPKLIVVPSVIGYSETTATTSLTNAGLMAVPTYEYSNDVPAGEVISQDPIGGSSVEAESEVILIISQGIEQVEVPDVYNETKDDAITMLEDLGFSVSIVEDYSEDIEEGSVSAQSIEAHTIVDRGTAITITVSIGPEIIYYSFSKEFAVPLGAVSVSYVLYDDLGNIVGEGTQALNAGYPMVTISKVNITTESGSLIVTWTIQAIDEYGNVVEYDSVGFDGTVDFVKQ